MGTVFADWINTVAISLPGLNAVLYRGNVKNTIAEV